MRVKTLKFRVNFRMSDLHGHPTLDIYKNNIEEYRIICKTRKFVNKSCLKQLYYALVPVCGNAKNTYIEPIIILQKKINYTF